MEIKSYIILGFFTKLNLLWEKLYKKIVKGKVYYLNTNPVNIKLH